MKDGTPETAGSLPLRDRIHGKGPLKKFLVHAGRKLAGHRL